MQFVGVCEDTDDTATQATHRLMIWHKNLSMELLATESDLSEGYG